MASPLLIAGGVAALAYALTKGAKSEAPKAAPKPAAPVETNPGSAAGVTSPTTDAVRPVTRTPTTPAGSTVAPTTTVKPSTTTADATITSSCPVGTRCAMPVSYSTYKAPTTTTSEPTPRQTSSSLSTLSSGGVGIYW